MKPVKQKETQPKESNFPEMKVISFKENEDGTATLKYEINDAYIDLIKNELNKTKITKKQINAWVLDMLEKAAKSEDRWEIKKVKKEK